MSVIQIQNKQFELYIPEEEIQKAVQKTALQIRDDLQNNNPLFICVLNGAFMFAADLMKCCNFPSEITFVKLQSYQGMNSTGNIKEIYGLLEDVEGRDVVIIEDVVDSGQTVSHLEQDIKKRNPKSFRIATLLLKPEAVKTGIRPDYVAMEIPNDFIVGYGLDYNGQGRNLKDIYVAKY